MSCRSLLAMASRRCICRTRRGARDWPSKPIRMMVGFGAGGGTDVATRIVAEPLGEVLGQRIVVENKPGAGGTIAGDLVAKGTKDGYNALMISTGHTVSAAMIKSQTYDAVKDFAPVGIIANSAIAIVVPKDFPANDLQGPDRGHQEGAGQIQLRHGRRRLDAASHRRAVPPARRPAGAGGVVPHHRRGRDRAAAEGRRLCGRSRPRGARPGRLGRAEAHRGDDRQALSRRCRTCRP